MKGNGSIDASLCQEVMPISLLVALDARTKNFGVFLVVNSENTLDTLCVLTLAAPPGYRVFFRLT